MSRSRGSNVGQGCPSTSDSTMSGAPSQAFESHKLPSGFRIGVSLEHSGKIRLQADESVGELVTFLPAQALS